jgi:hypothetical protein
VSTTALISSAVTSGLTVEERDEQEGRMEVGEDEKLIETRWRSRKEG